MEKHAKETNQELTEERVREIVREELRKIHDLVAVLLDPLANLPRGSSRPPDWQFRNQLDRRLLPSVLSPKLSRMAAPAREKSPGSHNFG